MSEAFHPTPDQHIALIYLAMGSENGMRAVGKSAKEAAEAYLAAYPTKRKAFRIVMAEHCTDNRGLKLYRYGSNSPRWSDVTRMTAPTLPDVQITSEHLPAFLETFKASFGQYLLYI